MIYDVRLFWGINDSYRVEADNEQEANKKVDELEKQFRDTIHSQVVSRSVRVSDDSFRLSGVYLLTKWSKHVPARCIRSQRSHNWRDDWEHTFEYLNSNKIVILKSLTGKLPKRVIKQLCSDNTINKPTCTDCPARFYCYTNKNRQNP